MDEKRITTDSIIDDLWVIAKNPSDPHVPLISLRAAERLGELKLRCMEFADILPACEGCSGKTELGERTEDCVYYVDGAYCMDRARKNYFALKSRVEELEAEVAKLKKHDFYDWCVIPRSEIVEMFEEIDVSTKYFHIPDGCAVISLKKLDEIKKKHGVIE